MRKYKYILHNVWRNFMFLCFFRPKSKEKIKFEQFAKHLSFFIIKNAPTLTENPRKYLFGWIIKLKWWLEEQQLCCKKRGHWNSLYSIKNTSYKMGKLNV